MNTSLWSDLLVAHWPELSARLGPRVEDFVAAARQKAGMHALRLDAAVARYVNLCFALGPNFEDKADNEWALALLSNEDLGEWVKVHQLVVRAVAELRRSQGDGGQAAAQLQQADAAFMDAHDALPRAPDSGPLTRVACDVDMLDIQLLEREWRREYVQNQGQWSLAPVAPTPVSVRMASGMAAPKRLTVLSHAQGHGPLARVQVRQIMHAVCDQDQHPALSLLGPHGLMRWQGYPARSISWVAPAQPVVEAPEGLATLLLEETQASISLLQAQCCGLRDVGVPTGAFETWLWCYPADQYLLALKRQVQLDWHWPLQGQVAQPPPQGQTHCRLERDGQTLPARAWERGLDQSLPEQLLQGFDALFAAWSTSCENCSMQASIGLLNGQAGLAWGWRESAQGMDEPAWMRFCAALDLQLQCELELSGEYQLGATRTRLRLLLKGQESLASQQERTGPEQALMDGLLALGTRWEWTFRIVFDPLAVDSGAMVSSVGACSGTLSGEFGLRPRTQGGGGWQWAMRLNTTPVAVSVAVHDPVLGQSQKTVPLLAAMKLLDWSLG